MKLSARTALLAATALAVNFAAPAFAQDAQEEADEAGRGNDIIVTAQRVEQRLQDVPISITVFSQEKLADNNILSAKDIATFTPGVYAQTRFGNDTTTYTIRGFAQEQRTTATVGTYFAEVVAPRGNGNSQGGDGASPGALFDLQQCAGAERPAGHAVRPQHHRRRGAAGAGQAQGQVRRLCRRPPSAISIAPASRA